MTEDQSPYARAIRLETATDSAEGESRDAAPGDPRFAFEAELNCLPMYAKRKLDRLTLKIGRAQWLKMSPADRVSIGQLPVGTDGECEASKKLVCGIMRSYGMEPAELPPDIQALAEPPIEVPAAVIVAAGEVGIKLDQRKWSQLSADQRYALTKLIDSGKKNKRRRALIEFLREPL